MASEIDAELRTPGGRMWKVSYGELELNVLAPKYDHGEFANRAMHVESKRVIEIPFHRRRDCERAVALLNRDYACNGMTDSIEIVGVLGSFLDLRKLLVEECCAW